MTTFPIAISLLRSAHSGAALLVALLAASGCAADASQESAEMGDVQSLARRPHDERELQAALDAIVAKGVPGAIALSRRGAHVLTETSGVRDLETAEPIHADDRFRAASTGKTLTATVILQLVEEGKLELEDSVEHWLPGLLPYGASISVRQLLNHTSGLTHNAHDLEVVGPYFEGDRAHYWSPAELMSIAASRPLAFAPGQSWLYSNTNYQVLGLVIEAVTQHTAVAEIEQRLFRPLGLRGSAWPVSETTLEEPYTRGYHFREEDFGPDTDVTEFSASWTWTAGGLVTTVSDLARFNRALLRGRLLGPAILEQMLETVPSTQGGAYGLGLERYETPCGPAWGHEGDFPGYHTLVLSSADGERQAVIALNSDDAFGIGLEDPYLARAAFAAFCRR